MSALQKAAQMALEALEAGDVVDPIFAGETIDALRAALAELVQEPQLKRIHPLDVPLEVFVADLSTRPRNIINYEMGYFTMLGDEYIKPPLAVRHLLMFSRKELRKWPNLGKRSLNEIEEMLRNRGVQLWEEHDDRSLRLLREHPTYFRAALAAGSGWTDADADAARLALELECLLTDKDVPMPALSRWWASGHDALDEAMRVARELNREAT